VRADVGKRHHVPLVVLLYVHSSLRRQDVKRCKLQITDRLHMPTVVSVSLDEPLGRATASVKVLLEPFKQVGLRGPQSRGRFGLGFAPDRLPLAD
jgi:hypothetical protein